MHSLTSMSKSATNEPPLISGLAPTKWLDLIAQLLHSESIGSGNNTKQVEPSLYNAYNTRGLNKHVLFAPQTTCSRSMQVTHK